MAASRYTVWFAFKNTLIHDGFKYAYGPLLSRNVKNSFIRSSSYSTVTAAKTKNKNKRRWRLAALATLGLAVGYGAYELYRRYQFSRDFRREVIPSVIEEYENSSDVSEVKVSRHVPNRNTEFSDLHLTLFQYQTCPFCCKVRAYLNYYGYGYNVVEVNPVLRKELKFSKYKKVPVLIYNRGDENKKLMDSSLIISALASLSYEKKCNSVGEVLKYYPTMKYKDENEKEIMEILNKYYVMRGENKLSETEAKSLQEEIKWRMWADDWLVHTLSPNIYRSWDEAKRSFYYFSDVGGWETNFSTFERYLVIYVGALAMYFIGKRLKKKYNLKEDVRESLYDACRFWTKAIGKDRTFMGGAKPNLADLSVFGILSAIEGCEAFQDLLTNTTIGPWYYKTKNAVDSHQGS